MLNPMTAFVTVRQLPACRFCTDRDAIADGLCRRHRALRNQARGRAHDWTREIVIRVSLQPVNARLRSWPEATRKTRSGVEDEQQAAGTQHIDQLLKCALSTNFGELCVSTNVQLMFCQLSRSVEYRALNTVAIPCLSLIAVAWLRDPVRVSRLLSGEQAQRIGQAIGRTRLPKRTGASLQVGAAARALERLAREKELLPKCGFKAARVTSPELASEIGRQNEGAHR